MGPLLRIASGAVLLMALALAVACGDSIDEVTPVAGVSDVSVRDNSFSPRAIEVAPGTEVTWEFQGKNSHNVVGDGWGSDVSQDGMYTHRFEAPGTYDYACTLHGGMRGRVLVAEGAGS